MAGLIGLIVWGILVIIVTAFMAGAKILNEREDERSRHESKRTSEKSTGNSDQV